MEKREKEERCHIQISIHLCNKCLKVNIISLGTDMYPICWGVMSDLSKGAFKM